MIEVLRSGSWATGERLLRFGVLGALTYFLVLVYLFGFSGLVTSQDNVVLSDFLSFWTAAREAINGRPITPYSPQAFAEIQQPYLAPGLYYGFFYPPTFLLLLLPLGALGSLGAFVIFQSVSLAGVALACSRIIGNWRGLLLAAAVPATFNAVFHGQSALLCAAFLGMGLIMLAEGRPVLAGIFIGLLTIKPQMGILIPFALLAGGYYRTFLSAAMTTLIFAFVSWLFFGTEVWQAFFEQAEVARTVLNNGQVDFQKMISVFAASRLSGLTVSAAYAVQVFFSIGALVAVIAAWRSPVSINIKAVVLIAAGYLASPFMLSYDLAAISVVVAFMIRETLGRQLFSWMWSVTAMGVLLSAATRNITIHTGIPIGPFVSVLFLWIGWKMMLVSQARQQPSLEQAA